MAPPSTANVIEIHTARLLPGADVGEFLRTNASLMADILRVPGLLARELVHDPESGLWTDIIRWRSREARSGAAAHFAANPHLHGFARYLDPATMTTVVVGDAVDLGVVAKS